jgi:hypothetical protein
MGTAMRFTAILRIMEGDYGRARRLLAMSARLFEELESRGDGYTISIVAAMHYHGDIAMHMEDYEEAVSHYRQCAMMCEGKGFYRGICIHLAKAAWCEVRMGRMSEAKEHLATAEPFLEGFQSRRGACICGGEIVFGLSALFDMWDGRFSRSREKLRSADDLSGIIHKPLCNAILLCIKAVMHDYGEPETRSLLDGGSKSYLAEAEALFKRIGFPRETEAFSQLRGYKPSNFSSF